MAEMWGMAGGLRNFLQDEMELSRIAIAQKEVENNEKHRAHLRDISGREMALKEGEARSAAELQALLAQAGQDDDTSTPEGQIKAYQSRANLLLRLGKVDEAAKLSNTAAQTLVRLENAANAESQQRKRDYELSEKKMRRVQEALTGVRNQADLDRVRMLFMQDPEMADEAMSPLLQKYDAQQLSTALAGSPALLAKRKADLDAFEAGSRDKLRKARMAYMDFRKGIDERQTSVNEAREKRLEKAGEDRASGGGGGGRGGGKPATEPIVKPAGKAITDLVSSALKDKGLLSGEMGMRVQQTSLLAEDVATLTQRNRGLSPAEAVEMAITNAQERGELTVANDIIGRSKPKFERKEGSAARPINLVPGQPTEFVKGRHYRDSKGNVARFDGSKFVPVYSASVKAPVRQPSMATNPLLEGDEEGDE